MNDLSSVDQRTLATRKQLREALFKTMQEKPLSKITVSDLCKLANINRTTFYYHYKKVTDILADIEDQMESELRTYLGSAKLEIGGDSQVEFYAGIFTYIQRHANVCKFILNSSNGLDFLEKVLDLARTKVFADISKSVTDGTTARIEYYYTFVSNGIIGMIRKWLANDMQESIEEMGKLTNVMCTACFLASPKN